MAEPDEPTPPAAHDPPEDSQVPEPRSEGAPPQKGAATAAGSEGAPETPPLAAEPGQAASEEPAEHETPALAARVSALAAAAKERGAQAFAAAKARLPTTEQLRALRANMKWTAPRFRAPRLPTWKGVALFAGGAFATMIVVVAGFFIYVTWGMPSVRDLWTARGNPSLTFVDIHGRVILREGAQNAPPVDLSRLPKYVPQAVIAIEDRRFYDHWGVDLEGLMRAEAANMKAGHVVQGGSTLTQQLAKNLFLTNERTWRRKLQEVALAFWLESQFTKKEILALYLSRVYFGAGAYGIDAASERYFDKPSKDLTLAEAALLAGLVKAPSRLNPAAQDTAAKARAKVVLDEMLDAKFITQKQHDDALKAPLAISRADPANDLGYFRNWIDPQLNKIIGDQRDDFVIETTLDLEAQRAGEKAIDTALDANGQVYHISQGALVAMDGTGGVRAMVGGRGYGKGEGQSEFNRVTQSHRQPGSSFKFFIYLTAMEMGLNPWTVRDDAPVTIGDWSPGNYEDKFYGPVPLVTAYAKSLNMVAIIVCHEIGGEAVIATAEKLGVKTKLYDYRSLALGAQGLPLIEMATGYGAMANAGSRIEPHGITRIKRGNGQVVWAFRPKKPDPMMSERARRLMNFMGSRVVQAGTGTRAQIPGRDIAGKTGTSNDYHDAWFLGYVPGLVAGVWIGNDDYSPMRKVTGGLFAAPIWHDFMVVALRDVPYRPLDLPRDEDMPPANVIDATTNEVVPTIMPASHGNGPMPLDTDNPPPPLPGGDG